MVAIFSNIQYDVFHQIYSLDTPVFTYTGDVCIKFFYSMYGSDIGSLVVLTSFRGVDNRVFTLFHDKGKLWHEAAVSTNISKNGKVDRVFEMSSGLMAPD